MEKRPIYIYDIPAEVLNSFSLKANLGAGPVAPVDAVRQEKAEVKEATSGTACSLCSQSFLAVQDWRTHQKSDVHHYNLKQKLRGLKPVTEAEFEKLVGDLDESLSGSDSSESDDDEGEDEVDNKRETKLSVLFNKQATVAEKNEPQHDNDGESRGGIQMAGSPLIWLSSPLLPQNMYYGIYKAIFANKELEDERRVLEVLRQKQLEPLSIPKPAKDGSLPQIAYKGPHIFLCMIGGGHFAAMVVSLAPKQTKHGPGPMNREATVLAHKTFHRYTTRRKQGGSQSANDNAKGTAHSAGSGLRRANETMLTDEVRALLQDWKGLIDTSELLLIRANGVTNRRTLFGPYEGQLLKANDPRVRGFPFSTRRATQKELMRAFIQLTRLSVEEIVPVEPTKEQATTPAKAATQKPTKPVLSEEEETALLHTSQLQAMIRRSKVPALVSYLTTNNLSPDFTFEPREQNYHAPTPLHLAASQNAHVMVTGLIVRAGADPTVTNKEGKTPFELAGDRATRDAFRVSRSEVSKWDWEAAKVPAPITKAEAEKRQEREKKESEAERKKQREDMLNASTELETVESAGKKRVGLLGAAEAKKTPQERREDEVRGLTPEMRVRLERERRARAAEERIRRMREGG
jgi:hypothetical protein